MLIIIEPKLDEGKIWISIYSNPGMLLNQILKETHKVLLNDECSQN